MGVLWCIVRSILLLSWWPFFSLFRLMLFSTKMYKEIITGNQTRKTDLSALDEGLTCVPHGDKETEDTLSFPYIRRWHTVTIEWPSGHVTKRWQDPSVMWQNNGVIFFFTPWPCWQPMKCVCVLTMYVRSHDAWRNVLVIGRKQAPEMLTANEMRMCPDNVCAITWRVT